MIRLLIVSVLLLSFPSVAASADIADLQVVLGEGAVNVSFTLVDAFHEEILDRIRSGLETSFSLEIRIDQEREMWLNRNIREAELKISCARDKIGGVYRITKSLEGRVFESIQVETEVEMMTAMSSVRKLKILDNGTLQRDEEYVVKVKAELLSRYVLLVVPWDIDTPWREKRFTFN